MGKKFSRRCYGILDRITPQPNRNKPRPPPLLNLLVHSAPHGPRSHENTPYPPITTSPPYASLLPRKNPHKQPIARTIPKLFPIPTPTSLHCNAILHHHPAPHTEPQGYPPTVYHSISRPGSPPTPLTRPPPLPCPRPGTTSPPCQAPHPTIPHDGGEPLHPRPPT
ncbi:unnamed protein product [Trichogramma brassicae]|uniref:Uncharacterized protein n=1 Tax=Trichogramma brassicae TaxID=86971 RepID=A0A6H5IXC8_9HYME|nr:unnamed protein product [Trichogramma brassicae]